MGQSVVKQPDGLFAVFSTVSDTFEVTDATEEELIQFLIEDELTWIRARVAATVEKAKTQGQSGRRSYQDCLQLERRANYSVGDPRYSPED